MMLTISHPVPASLWHVGTGFSSKCKQEHKTANGRADTSSASNAPDLRPHPERRRSGSPSECRTPLPIASSGHRIIASECGSHGLPSCFPLSVQIAPLGAMHAANPITMRQLITGSLKPRNSKLQLSHVQQRGMSPNQTRPGRLS